MSDLTYSWKFYVFNLLNDVFHTGDLKGTANQITLTTAERANNTSPLGTGITLTYRFSSGTPEINPVENSGYIDEPFSDELKALGRDIFAEFSSLINVTFTEISAEQPANISIYQHTNGGSYASPSFFDVSNFQAEMSMTSTDFMSDGSDLHNDFKHDQWIDAFRHELGHVLGLSHPAEYNQAFFDTGYIPTNPNPTDIPLDEETAQFSVMSYVDHAFLFERGEVAHKYFEKIHNVHGHTTSESLGIYDIKALQFLYGANTIPTAGDEVYTFRSQNATLRTIYDSAGIDTFDLSNQDSGTEVNLNEASFSSIGLIFTTPNRTFLDENQQSTDWIGRPDKDVLFENNIGIAWDTVIENVLGSEHDDTIEGNQTSNSIKGGSGDDMLSGAAGDDVLSGAQGSDTLNGGDGNDQLWAGKGDDAGDHMTGGNGNDTIGAGVGADTIEGGNGSDHIFGGDGDDEISAGSASDFIYGGTGNDQLNGDNGADVIYGGAGAGNDNITGGEGNDKIYAGQGDDAVDGGSGADLIFSGKGSDTVQGSAGNDTMWGGDGDDIFTGGEGSDLFAFGLSNGHDTVTDFDPDEDKIDLSAFNLTTISSYASDHIQNGVAGSLLSLNSDTTIFLEGISAQGITDSAIIF